MRCIRIGYGHVAQWHEKKLKELGIQTIGIIENNLAKAKLAELNGFNVLSSYKEAVKLKPLFWDICTCTASHVEIIENIIQVSADANILIEKPICLLSQLDELKTVLKHFNGKITVNENYNSSNITRIVREYVHQLEMLPSHIISEMSKNRSHDIAKGRFLDTENFAFGYEGTHMVANVISLGQKYMPLRNHGTHYQDMHINFPTYKEYLHKQGSAKKRYQSVNNTEVTLYTSMEGNIGHIFPQSPYKNNFIPADDHNTRYRILAVKDEIRNITVVGYYEPVVNLPRPFGVVMVLKNDKVKECTSPIEDDTMRTSMSQTIAYFKGNEINPYNLSEAIDNIFIMST